MKGVVDTVQPIELEIPSHEGDDPQFVDLVRWIISAELELKPVQEIIVIRIDNWFDHKWLDFSGIGRVAFGTYYDFPTPDRALDEFRQRKKTFPPFSPKRVIA